MSPLGPSSYYFTAITDEENFEDFIERKNSMKADLFWKIGESDSTESAALNFPLYLLLDKFFGASHEFAEDPLDLAKRVEAKVEALSLKDLSQEKAACLGELLLELLSSMDDGEGKELFVQKSFDFIESVLLDEKQNAHLFKKHLLYLQAISPQFSEQELSLQLVECLISKVDSLEDSWEKAKLSSQLARELFFLKDQRALSYIDKALSIFLICPPESKESYKAWAENQVLLVEYALFNPGKTPSLFEAELEQAKFVVDSLKQGEKEPVLSSKILFLAGVIAFFKKEKQESEEFMAAALKIAESYPRDRLAKQTRQQIAAFKAL